MKNRTSQRRTKKPTYAQRVFFEFAEIMRRGKFIKGLSFDSLRERVCKTAGEHGEKLGPQTRRYVLATLKSAERKGYITYDASTDLIILRDKVQQSLGKINNLYQESDSDRRLNVHDDIVEIFPLTTNRKAAAVELLSTPCCTHSPYAMPTDSLPYHEYATVSVNTDEHMMGLQSPGFIHDAITPLKRMLGRVSRQSSKVIYPSPSNGEDDGMDVDGDTTLVDDSEDDIMESIGNAPFFPPRSENVHSQSSSPDPEPAENTEMQGIIQTNARLQQELKGCHQEMDDLKDKLHTQNTEKNALLANLMECKLSLEQYEQKCQRLENELSSCRDEVDRLEKDLAETNSDTAALQSKINELEASEIKKSLQLGQAQEEIQILKDRRQQDENTIASQLRLMMDAVHLQYHPPSSTVG